jgi:hypothetical protein
MKDQKYLVLSMVLRTGTGDRWSISSQRKVWKGRSPSFLLLVSKLHDYEDGGLYVAPSPVCLTLRHFEQLLKNFLVRMTDHLHSTHVEIAEISTTCRSHIYYSSPSWQHKRRNDRFNCSVTFLYLLLPESLDVCCHRAGSIFGTMDRRFASCLC